ncbi:MAG: ATP-binding protein [Rhizobiaceae bacterium]|nr:ATP-binding protein [Rhizobiaceae bacterium]
MADYTNVNRAAPLRNVAAFSTLLTKMVERDGELPGLACFYGPSGWGKTKSAVYGANRYRATYVECGQFTTARSLLENILIERGNRSPRGSIEQMKTKAVEMIAAEPHRPLIVDEAHWIAQKRFVDLLREISDKSGAAVILIGEEMLPQSLEQFERVHNRVLEWVAAEPCDAGDFALLAKARCPGITIAPDLAAAILQRTEGNTRRIVVNLEKASGIAQLTGEKTITLDLFGGPQAIVGRTSLQPRRYK